MSELKCNFCGKTQSMVSKLVAGPGVYICDECVDLCSEIVEEELGGGERAADVNPIPYQDRGYRVIIPPIPVSEIEKGFSVTITIKSNTEKTKSEESNEFDGRVNING